jgi:hypothetical protein
MTQHALALAGVPCNVMQHTKERGYKMATKAYPSGIKVRPQKPASSSTCWVLSNLTFAAATTSPDRPASSVEKHMYIEEPARPRCSTPIHLQLLGEEGRPSMCASHQHQSRPDQHSRQHTPGPRHSSTDTAASPAAALLFYAARCPLSCAPMWLFGDQGGCPQTRTAASLH